MPLAPLPETKLRRLRALLSRNLREKYRECIVEGARIVDEALRSSWTVEFLCISQSGRVHLDKLSEHRHPVYIVSEDEFSTISTTEHSQGILAVVRMSTEPAPPPRDGIILALDRISDPGNVGTIIRNADWFGVQLVLLGKGCADLYNPKTIRATMGSLFHLPVISDVNLLDACEKSAQEGFALWCADMDGGPVTAAHRAMPRALLIIGSEAHGVDPAIRAKMQESIGIPRIGKAESLNAASATAAMLALLM